MEYLPTLTLKTSSKPSQCRPIFHTYMDCLGILSAPPGCRGVCGFGAMPFEPNTSTRFRWQPSKWRRSCFASYTHHMNFHVLNRIAPTLTICALNTQRVLNSSVQTCTNLCYEGFNPIVMEAHHRIAIAGPTSLAVTCRPLNLSTSWQVRDNVALLISLHASRPQRPQLGSTHSCPVLAVPVLSRWHPCGGTDPSGGTDSARYILGFVERLLSSQFCKTTRLRLSFRKYTFIHKFLIYREMILQTILVSLRAQPR